MGRAVSEIRSRSPSHTKLIKILIKTKLLQKSSGGNYYDRIAFGCLHNYIYSIYAVLEGVYIKQRLINNLYCFFSTNLLDLQVSPILMSTNKKHTRYSAYHVYLIILLKQSSLWAAFIILLEFSREILTYSTFTKNKKQKNTNIACKKG